MTRLSSSLLCSSDLYSQFSILLRLKNFWCSLFCGPTARRWPAQCVAILPLLLMGLPAHALTYTFADGSIVLPAGCTDDNLPLNYSGNYTCIAAISMAAGDTIIIDDTKPVTIKVNGAFITGVGTMINTGGATSDLKLVINGALTLGASTTLNANVETIGAGAVAIGADSWISGNLSTQTGAVTIGAATIPTPPPPASPNTGVGGNINTVTGFVSMGADSVINGSVTTQSAGYVVLGANAIISGSIETLGAGYVGLGADALVDGSITVSGTTGADYVTTGAGSIVNGNISTAGSYITLGANTQVSGSISTQKSYITIGADCKVGSLVAMNDPTPSYVTIGASSEVYAVCCNGIDASCVTDGSGITPGPLVCPDLSSSIPGSFACLETGTNSSWDATARQPLYTKLVSTDFTLDIAALGTLGALETDYVANSGSAKSVTVELVDGAGTTACASRTTISMSQTLVFNDVDAGRKSITAWAVSDAHANLRCRVTDANQTPNVVACSTDNFAVRPQAFIVSSTNANADGSGTNTTASPAIKAGASFNLTADTSAVGYNGTPILDANLVEAHSNSSTNGTLSGAFSAADAGTGSAAGNAFAYSEVGYFKLGVNSLIDSSFTTVDQPDDCTDDFSNTLNGNKYGCKFGNITTTDYLGRFVPDHFDVVVAKACSAGDFTYSGQPFSVTITAKNGLVIPATTLNYNGSTAPSFAKTVTLTDANALAGGDLTPTSILASAFSLGVANPTPAFTFTSAATAPASIKIRALDTDNVNSTGYDLSATTLVRSGRVRFLNAYGSELLDLPMILRAQYWQDTNSGWQTNTADSCTNATLSFSAVAMPDITDNTCVMDTGLALGNSGKGCSVAASSTKQFKEMGVSGFAGDFNLWLKAPGSDNTGSIDVEAIVPSWLQYNWIGVVANPKGRATFGVYKSKSNKVIHRREMY
ncbi:MAG: hypothetical protein ACI9C4_001851 [Paraglaciecola sp.]|jgi:hypothetical protein